MFIAAKLLALITQPLVYVVVLLAAGLLLTRYRPSLSRRLTGAALTVLLVMGWMPLPDLLVRQLEGQYAELSLIHI